MKSRTKNEQGFAAAMAIILLAVAGIASAVLYSTLDQDRSRLNVDKASVADEQLADSAAAILQAFYKIPTAGNPVLYPKPYLVNGTHSMASNYVTPPQTNSSWTVQGSDDNGVNIQFAVPTLTRGIAFTDPGIFRTFGGTPTTIHNVLATTLGYNREDTTHPALITSVDAQIGGNRRYRIKVDPPPPPTCKLAGANGQRVKFNSNQTVVLSAAGIAVKAEFIINGKIVPVNATGAVPFPTNTELLSPMAAIAGGTHVVNVGPSYNYVVKARVYGVDGQSNTCQVTFNSVTDPPLCSITRLGPATVVQGTPVKVQIVHIGGGPPLATPPPPYAHHISTVSAAGPWINFTPATYTYPGGSMTSDGPFALKHYTFYGQATGPGGTGACANTASVDIAPPTVCEVAIDPPASIIATKAAPTAHAHINLISGIVTQQFLSWDSTTVASSTWNFDGTQPGMDKVRNVTVKGKAQGPYQTKMCTAALLHVLPTDPVCHITLTNNAALDVTDWNTKTTAKIVVDNPLASLPSVYAIWHPSGWQWSQATTIYGPQLAGYGDQAVVNGNAAGTTGNSIACTPATIKLLPVCHMLATGTTTLTRGDPNSCIDVWVATDQGTPTAKSNTDTNGTSWLNLADPRSRYCGSDFNGSPGVSAWWVNGTQYGPYGSKWCGTQSFSVVNPPPPTCTLTDTWPNKIIVNGATPSSTTVTLNTSGTEFASGGAAIFWPGLGSAGPAWNGWSKAFTGANVPGGMYGTFNIQGWVSGFGGTNTCQLNIPIEIDGISGSVCLGGPACNIAYVTHSFAEAKLCKDHGNPLGCDNDPDCGPEYDLRRCNCTCSSNTELPFVDPNTCRRHNPDKDVGPHNWVTQCTALTPKGPK